MNLDIKGRIRTVQRTEDNDYGDTWLAGDRFDIRIALNKNKYVDEFTATLLHEMLHVWFTITKKVCRIKVSNAKEHEIIEQVEAVILYFVHLNLKQRKN